MNLYVFIPKTPFRRLQPSISRKKTTLKAPTSCNCLQDKAFGEVNPNCQNNSKQIPLTEPSAGTMQKTQDGRRKTEGRRQEAESRKQEPPRFDQTSARGGKALKQALRIKVTFFVFNSERIRPPVVPPFQEQKWGDEVAGAVAKRRGKPSEFMYFFC